MKKERFTARQPQRPIDGRTARALGLDKPGMPYASKGVLPRGQGQVRVDDFWLTVDLGEGWRAALRLMPHRGQAVVGELRVFPADEFPGQEAGQWGAEYLGVRAWERVPEDLRTGITARLLRRVPLGAHLKHGREMIATLGKRVGWRDLVDRGLYAERMEKRPRPDRRPDVFYAQIASEYTTRVEAGSRRPVADVAGRRRLPVGVIRDAVHEARMRGFLTPGAVGKPGGALTSKATRLLRSKRKAKR